MPAPAATEASPVESARTPGGSAPSAAPGPGAGRVGVAGIVGLVAYLAAFSILLLYVLVVMWPVPTPARTSPSGPAPAPAQEQVEPAAVSVFGTTWKVWDEERLLILVVAAGALGSLVHALRSMYWYVGNRSLVRSWIPKYILLPFCGATLAVLFYFVVRGGFFSPEAGFKETSPFGFCALASLVGLFSEQAVLKLKQVAETVFTKTEAGEDAKPPTSKQ